MRSLSMGATAVAGAALLLSGCGSGAETQSTVTVTESAAPTSTTEIVSPPPTTPQADASPPVRPTRNQCVRVKPVPDGRYQVFDAGSAVVTFADNRLTLGPVTAGEGWTHRVDDQEPEEVEIAFRRGAEELDLEVEVDNGRLEVSICNDDV